MAETSEPALDKPDDVGEGPATLSNEADNAHEEHIQQCPESERTLLELPTEIWREIFQRITLPPRAVFLSRTEAPLSLLHTCRKWRVLALSTPQLWAEINIEVKKTNSLNAPDRSMKIYPRLELLELKLRASARHPLSISIWEGERPSYITAEDLATRLMFVVFRRLFVTSPRWKSLRLSLPGMTSGDLLPYFRMVSHFPELETLSLMTTFSVTKRRIGSSQLGNFVAERYFPSQFWRNSPKLRNLYLHVTIARNNQAGYRNPVPISGWATPATHIPFHQLTELTLDGDENETVTIEELFGIIQVARELVTLKVFHVRTRSVPPEHVHPTPCLPHLRHLQLEICTTDQDAFDPLDGEHISITTILSYFNAPSLVDLSLGWDDRLDPGSLGSFIERSGCSLEAFALNDSPISSDDLISCLELLPTLKSFCRTMISPTQNSASATAWTRLREFALWDDEVSQFALCPLLEEITIDMGSLEIEFADSEEETFGYSFAEMVEFRIERSRLPDGTSRFKKVTLKGQIQDPCSEHGELQDLRLPPFNLNLVEIKNWPVDNSSPMPLPPR